VSVDVRQVAAPDELEAALELRTEVFVGEQGVTPEEDKDGRDDDATHFVALDDGRVIGACRVLVDGDRARFGRLVVARERRREGVGKALLAEAELWARSRGATEIVLAAQTDAQSLYEQAGYATRGAPFMEARIEHVIMDKTLV
jgi:predicted GNAT family N-acyltransferase